jgi:hypothetical protein
MACVPYNNVGMHGGGLCGLCLCCVCGGGCVGKVLFGFGVNMVMG